MTTEARTQIDPGTDHVTVGEKFGFYRALSAAPLTAAALAKRTGRPIGFVREWLAGQTEDGYLTRDAASGRYANWCSVPQAA
ncbi:MAG TPA: hypothetical protein VIW01_12375 [Dehalococcoidia bacterium]